MDINEQTPEMIAADLAALKEKADTLGVPYHPSIGAEKLREKIQLHLNPPAPAVEAPSVIPKPAPAEFNLGKPEAPAPAPAEPVELTVGQKRAKLKADALALIRVRLTCMNPAKKEWDGEILTCGNSLIGTVSKFIPFNNDEGWHIPRIMFNMLKERQCQIFVESKTKKGSREGKIIREFAIEVLDPLTPDELAALAARQAATRSID